ncbi:MAG: HD domain-containing protein [Clostridiales bacterium]|jgi:hypothetical protein|nr:HD domain-containing protein [Clostridiales bacterium]
MTDITDEAPAIAEAENILLWAAGRNPGRWVAHSRVAARAAKVIAENCRPAAVNPLSGRGLNAQRAYIFGLLHDIGRYEGQRYMHHIIAGYELLHKKGMDLSARICLTHSFPYQKMESYLGARDCSAEELAFIESFLSVAVYDDYDKLIQLCDAVALPEGVCLVETRLIDVAMRYGFSDYTREKWKAVFQLKEYFSGLCGQSIYELFADEVRRNSFSL